VRAPNERKTDELVAAIIGEFAIANPNFYVPSIEADVRAFVAALQNRGNEEPALGYEVDNKRRAERLRTWIEQGQALLAEMPKTFRTVLFIGRASELYDFLDREVALRQQRILSLLQSLATRCDSIIERGIGAHRATDFEKLRAATAARYFTERCGIPLAYSNPNSAYCVTAPLFYEAATGRPVQDLKRACENVAQLPNWEEIRAQFEAAKISFHGEIPAVAPDSLPEDRFIDNDC
jgi:hypothetical protein